MQNRFITYFWETPCKPPQRWHSLDTKVRHKVPEGRAEGTAAATESHRSEGGGRACQVTSWRHKSRFRRWGCHGPSRTSVFSCQSQPGARGLCFLLITTRGHHPASSESQYLCTRGPHHSPVFLKPRHSSTVSSSESTHNIKAFNVFFFLKNSVFSKLFFLFF